MRTCSAWALLPPVYSACTAAGLWLVYLVAVNDGHVEPLSSQRRRNGSAYPPDISIAGNSPPASCIFSQVMNLAAFVGFVIGVLRFLQLKRTSAAPRLNVCSLLAVSAGCFGMTLVGNFQLSSQETVHNLGTLLTFGPGTLFCWLQTYVALRVHLRGEGRRVGAARFLLSGAVTVCVVVRSVLMRQGVHMAAASGRSSCSSSSSSAPSASTFVTAAFGAACADVAERPAEADPDGPGYRL